jgi:hypothetical protein
MTIKQNGGVFGRNPTFNDVTVEGDLTVDGAVVHTGDLTVDNINLSGNTISITDANGNLNLDANGAGRILSNYDVCLGNTVPNVVSNYAAQQGFGWDYSAYTLEVASNSAALQLGRQSGGLDGQVLVIRQASNVAAEIRVASNAGYFKPYNGGGIDFSATSDAPGATSEILDDYEEGTWTPIDSSGAGLTFTASSGSYTKVGRMVMATGFVNFPVTADGSNNKIGGLPFANIDSTSRGVGAVNYKQVADVDTLLPENNATTFFFATATGSSTTNAQISNTAVYFGLVYTAS